MSVEELPGGAAAGINPATVLSYNGTPMCASLSPEMPEPCC